MEFSREIHHLIVRNVTARSDLVTLCTVSKMFQQEAERALYNTLHLRGFARTMAVCRTLASCFRLSRLVEALSVFIADDRPEDSSEEDGEEPAIPSEFWDVVASALRHVKKLRFFSIYFEQSQDTAKAWVLSGCTFQLQTFHCDFEWDNDLVAFLRSQTDITDLYLADYRKDIRLDRPLRGSSRPSSQSIALPKLSMLECTFSEAAMALVPGRPVLRVKTCLSNSEDEEKKLEMDELLAKLKMSRKALCAFDLADESYTDDFSLELLTSMGSECARFSELRYLGTLVLPVDGNKVRRGQSGPPFATPDVTCVLACPEGRLLWASHAIPCAAMRGTRGVGMGAASDDPCGPEGLDIRAPHLLSLDFEGGVRL